jgi:hypothetical protein
VKATSLPTETDKKSNISSLTFAAAFRKLAWICQKHHPGALFFNCFHMDTP